MARNKSNIRYPRKAKFTIADLIALNDSLNAQTVRTFVREAIYVGSVKVVGETESTGRGRPSFILSLA